MKKNNAISRFFDRWAHRSKIRIYVAGVGGTTCEWDSLRSSFYKHLRPTVQRVYEASEADLIALHGPLSDIALERMSELSERVQLPIVAVGGDLSVSPEGFLRDRQGAQTQIRLAASLVQNFPTPEDLHRLASKVVGHV